MMGIDSSRQTISADFTSLSDQANWTTKDRLKYAVDAIDEMFGEGYSAENPDLVVGFIQTAQSDFGAATLAQQVRAGLSHIADVLECVQFTND